MTDLQNISQFKTNMPPLGLANTKISTGYAQKSPRSLVLYTIGQQTGQAFGRPKKWKCGLNPTRRERTTRIRLPSIPGWLYASTRDLASPPSVKWTWLYFLFFDQWELLLCNGHGPLVLCVNGPNLIITKNLGSIILHYFPPNLVSAYGSSFLQHDMEATLINMGCQFSMPR